MEDNKSLRSFLPCVLAAPPKPLAELLLATLRLAGAAEDRVPLVTTSPLLSLRAGAGGASSSSSPSSTSIMLSLESSPAPARTRFNSSIRMAPEFVTLLAPSPRPDVLLLGRRPAGLRLTSRLRTLPAREPLNDVDLGAAAATVARSSSFVQTAKSSSIQDCGRSALDRLGAARKSLGAINACAVGIGNALDKLFAVVEGLQSLRLNSSRCQLCRSGCGHLCNSRQGHCRNLKTMDPDSRLLSTNNLRLYFIADNGMLEVELVSHCPQVTMDQATKSNFGLGILNSLNVFLQTENHGKTRSNSIDA
ncbi:hypothetical protein KCU93_g411, partial [Aureobasidium melanogenum]